MVLGATLRALLKAPGFTAAAVTTLALGIGANSAIFSLVKTVLLTPLPYADANRLVMIWNTTTPDDLTWLSIPEVVNYRADARTLMQVGGYIQRDANLTGSDDPERVAAAVVTGELFDTLGVASALGRTLAARDSAPGAPETVVLSHDLWRRRFGAAPHIVGERILIDGRLREVVGVMPPGFKLPFDYHGSRPTELWTPAVVDPGNLGEWGNRSYLTVARLAPGVTPAEATAELAVIGDRWVQSRFISLALGDSLNRTALPLHDFIAGDVARVLLLLMGAVGLVLVIACANVVNLLLARADARRREVALRSALGAGRGVLVRQFLAESIVLSAAGAVAGVILAAAGLRVLDTLRPAGLPRLDEATIDATTLLFTALIALGCGLVFGLWPALQMTRPDLTAVLNESGRGAVAGRTRLFVRRGLVVAQLAVSVMLVIGAGLLIRSLVALQQVDLGFDDRGVLTAQMQLPATSYPDGPSIVQFYRDVTERLAQLPGVTAAGGVRVLPLSRSIGDWSITIEGRSTSAGDNPNGDFQFATPGYFEAMGFSLLRGRWLTAADRENAPLVVLVNDTMAARYWPSQDALGQRFKMGGADSTRPLMTIVGVIKTSRHNAVVETPRAEMYLPHAQLPATTGITAARTMALVVKTANDPLALAPAVRAVVRGVDPHLPVAQLQTMEQITATALAAPRFAAFLLGVFALLALLLAALGTYATISLLVAERATEIGIRMALGAVRASIIAAVLREGLALALGGIVVGVAGALFFTRTITSLLYGVRAADPVTLAVVPAILAAVALVATWVPAYRAASVNPVQTLRRG